ncbi:MAG: peptide ABC transporter substrate-binding protein [Candidatus Eremiobacteraeota bacterium]|nr:peptide ABC transporter substrate-binding protein [Candidatus Eremiobacteraeota bacterium]
MKKLGASSLALVVLAAACTKTGGGPAGAGGAGQRQSFTIPHTLRLTDGEDVKALNTLITQDTPVSLIIAPLTMAWLVKWDRDNQATPELAMEVPTQANGGVSKDGLTITYHLRKGVKWSDGVPFTADDVIFSFKAVLNPTNNVVSRTGFDLVQKMDEPDKYTVVLHMKKPYSPFVETFFSTSGAEPSLLPVHLLAQFPNLNNVAYNAKPVGIGPFKVQEWKRAQNVTLVANPLYFRGRPKLDKIVYEIITENNTILTQMQAKNMDLWYQAPQNFIDQLKALQPFTTEARPSYYFRHIDFNLTSPKLKEVAVRQALRYATDRKQILDTVYHGIGHLQDQPAPRTAPYWDPTIQPVPFDLNKAKQLLDQAGWKPGADGVREKNGVRLDLDFATASGTNINDQMIEQLRSTWKQIGVNITVHHYQNNLLFAQYADGGILYTGKFDVAYFAWGQDALGDASPIYSCKSIPPNGQNIMHWCNQRAQAAMDAFFTHFDQAQRNKDAAIVYEELNKDVPTIVLMGTEALWSYNKDMKSFDPGALAPFDDFMNVDV